MKSVVQSPAAVAAMAPSPMVMTMAAPSRLTR